MPPDGELAPAPRRAMPRWVKAAISAALLGYLFTRGGARAVAEVAAVLRGAGAAWLAAAFALYVASHAVNALRWRTYAREFGLGGGAADFLRLYFAGLFVNLFAPGTIAGDVSRGLGLAGGRRRAAALGSVVAHRVSGMIALLALAGVAALVQRDYPLPAAARWFAIAAPAAAAATLVAAPSLVAMAAQWFGRAIVLPPAWGAATARSLLVAAGYHALQVAATMCLARAVAIDVRAAALATAVLLINGLSMVPVSLSGVGVREAGYAWMLPVLGVAADRSLALGLLGSALVLATGLAGAPAFLSRSRIERD